MGDKHDNKHKKKKTKKELKAEHHAELMARKSGNNVLKFEPKSQDTSKKAA